MPATTNPLSDELQRQIEQIAREQQREPAEVLEDAVRRYIGVKAHERLALKAGERARSLGIREEDIADLVHEVRRENRERGR